MTGWKCLLACAAVLAFGCGPRIGSVKPAQFESERLSMLQPGITKREEIVCEFGEPTTRFADGYIEGYRFLLDWNDETVVVRSGAENLDAILNRKGEYHLVLVYGPDGRLVRHRVLRVSP